MVSFEEKRVWACSRVGVLSMAVVKWPDGAVGEEEGLPSGCSRVGGDGVVGVGINVGGSGGTGEKEPELLVGNEGEV